MLFWNSQEITQRIHFYHNLAHLIQHLNILKNQIDCLQNKNAFLQLMIEEINKKTAEIHHFISENQTVTGKSQTQASCESFKRKTNHGSSVQKKLLEKKQNMSEKQVDKSRKRIRKIEKEFYCPYNDCERIYKSSFSLNLHIKIYHKGGSKRQREKYASIILQAEKNGKQPPQIPINFPPNFLKEFRSNFEYMKIYKM